VVGVLFLLVIFLLLGSLVYTPGVLVKFDGSSTVSTNIITISRDGDIIFAGKTNKASDLPQLRAEDFKNAPGSNPFCIQAAPGADPKLVEQVRGLFQIQLPDGEKLAGTDNPTVVVAVNFRGQCFFENKAVQESELKAELRRRLLEAGHNSKELTLVLWADKAVQNDVVMHLYRLAREAGIKEFLLAERPSVFAAPAARSPP